jgi:hypothetical protein
MARRALSGFGQECSSLAICRSGAGTAHRAALGERGDTWLGLRTDSAARIRSRNTDMEIGHRSGRTLRSLTFAVSPADHLRQNRFHVEAELDHNLPEGRERCEPAAGSQRRSLSARNRDLSGVGVTHRAPQGELTAASRPFKQQLFHKRVRASI